MTPLVPAAVISSLIAVYALNPSGVFDLQTKDRHLAEELKERHMKVVDMARNTALSDGVVVLPTHPSLTPSANFTSYRATGGGREVVVTYAPFGDAEHDADMRSAFAHLDERAFRAIPMTFIGDFAADAGTGSSLGGTSLAGLALPLPDGVPAVVTIVGSAP